MMELITLLAIYYACSEEAAHGRLTQEERFTCNLTYQQAKRLFLDDVDLAPNTPLSPAQNVEAFRRFKAWEAENADLVAQLKAH